MTSDQGTFDDESDLEDPELAAVADAILDGTPVNWAAAESRGSTGPALTPPLRVLESLAALHRKLSLGESEAAPRSWGHLQLLNKVGQGAFGEVFRAWDPHLNREVALKLFASGDTSQDPDRRMWVLEEARFLAAVRHPNVITVHGADWIDGRAGFWTEFIHGRTLTELVREQGVFSAEQAIALGLDVCRAVSAVHHAGLLHRDIKTSNVMRDADGRIVLLDFGASKDFVGTPLYVAPELWEGGAATVQSDIYSVGVLLYFLVTGSYPVRGATVHAVGEAHRAGRRTSLREERPDLPDEFVDAVNKAIDPDPAKRFSSAVDLESTLGRARTASIESHKNRVAHWAIGRLAFVSVVVLALVGYTAYAVSQQKTAAPAKVRMPNNVMGHGSRDGRFIPYVGDDGSINVVKIATGGVHPVVQPTASGESGVRGTSLVAMSPNGDRVAYTWSLGRDAYELRLVNVDGTKASTLLERRDAYQPMPVDWSPDGRAVLCWFRQKAGGADLVLVPIDEGPPKPLYRKPIGGVPFTSLSPDGRFVTFERAVLAEGQPTHGQVVILGMNGGEPKPIFPTVGDESGPVWTDDTHLLFFKPSMDVPASTDAWIVRVIDGVTRGSPVKVFDNVGPWRQMVAVPGKGLVYHFVETTSAEVFVRSIDLVGTSPPGAPVRISETEINRHAAPSWSPSRVGRSIAYFTLRPSPVFGNVPLATLTVQDLSSGKTRVIETKLPFLPARTPQWLDEQTVIVWGAYQGTDPPGIYRVNVQTGHTSLLLVGAPGSMQPGLLQVMIDGSGVYYLDPKRGIVAHKFLAGVDEVVVSLAGWSAINRFSLSADGHALAFAARRSENGQTIEDVLMVKPLDGTAHEIQRASRPDALFLQSWTPDSQHVLYSRGTQTPLQVWMLPANGGKPRDMQFALPIEPNPLTVSPDGHVAYPERIVGQELWIRPIPSDARTRR